MFCPLEFAIENRHYKKKYDIYEHDFLSIDQSFTSKSEGTHKMVRRNGLFQVIIVLTVFLNRHYTLPFQISAWYFSSTITSTKVEGPMIAENIAAH